jgi:hypothetical protein
LLRSLPAAEVTVTTGDASAALVQWDPVPGAAEYYVYGRTRGAQTMYWRTTGTSIVDDGMVVGTAGTPPATGTTWQVKNLFELKNARRVQIDRNIIENNWEQAQAGTAILFTPRNQYGRCTWCRVEDVVFEYNIVRRTGGAIQILGWDDERPSSQLTNITIRHNEFSDFGKSYGGNGYFLYMIDEPKDVTVDHNTIISPNGGGVIMADKRASINFVFTNNVARHNTYGIFGSGYSTGLTTIARFFPGSVIERNVLAGGSATKYPAGNFFPTYAEFEAHFVDYAGGNYDLVPGTDWALAGTDGDDLGADMSLVRGPFDGSGDPVVVSTVSLPAATQGEPYSAALTASGGTQPYLWEIVAGSLPTGLWLDAAGSITGTPVPEGPFAITVKAADVWGNSALQPLTLTVVGTADPVEILTAALDDGLVGTPYAQALQAMGGSGAYVWTVTGGALPAGLSLAANGVLSGTPLEVFSGVVTLTAADAADPGRSASQSYNLIVAGPPNRLPTVTITSPTAGSVVQVGATLTLAAAATDPDGSIARIDFYVNGLPVGTAVAPATTVAWQVNTSGPHSVHAVAIDDEVGNRSLCLRRQEARRFLSDARRFDRCRWLRALQPESRHHVQLGAGSAAELYRVHVPGGGRKAVPVLAPWQG